MLGYHVGRGLLTEPPCAPAAGGQETLANSRLTIGDGPHQGTCFNMFASTRHRIHSVDLLALLATSRRRSGDLG